MYNRIGLARQALVLFLYSLPPNSRFNVISYGSKFSYLFDENQGRSVEYNDENIKYAAEQVEAFMADFGGTDIYSPLQDFYSREKDQSVQETNVMLLTDGAVFNTDRVVQLVKSKSSPLQRLHTFGVGAGASELLIKNCAFAGYGSYFFIYNESQIEENVVSAIENTSISYKLI